MKAIQDYLANHNKIVEALAQLPSEPVPLKLEELKKDMVVYCRYGYKGMRITSVSDTDVRARYGDSLLKFTKYNKDNTLAIRGTGKYAITSFYKVYATAADLNAVDKRTYVESELGRCLKGTEYLKKLLGIAEHEQTAR